MRSIVKIHRWLGVVACVAVLMFAGSGVLHPVMSRLQPQPAQFVAPAVVLPSAPLPLRTVLLQHNIGEFAAATLVQLPNGAAYRVRTQADTRYFAAATGAAIRGGERIHAEYLARHFAGDQQSIILHVARTAQFDDDYIFINRLLPVWRFDFERSDGLRVYVDTEGNRLASLSDRLKRAFQTVFRTLHSFTFLDEDGIARVIVMLVLLGATFTTAMAGMVMYVRLGRAAQRLQRLPVRRWHRHLSLVTAIVMFSFTVSGAWHLLQGRVRVSVPVWAGETFHTDALGDVTAAGAFVLMRSDNALCYLQQAAPAPDTHAHHASHAEHPHAVSPPCLDTATGQPVANAETVRAEQLARFYARTQAPLAAVDRVTGFDGEYGFVNKRLPVWRVKFADADTRWYVETSSGELALRADAGAAREGWVFSIFHKARFIGDAWKDARDIFLVTAALGCIVVSLLGFWLFIRQPESQRRPA